jgi:drug/metabolite transporter (DMT)-like permease
LNAHPAPNIILLGALFGTTLVASRFSVGQMAPLTYISLRLSLSAVGFLLIYLLPNTKKKWPRGNGLWWNGAILGIFGTALPMVSFVSSLQYLSSGVTSVLMTTTPAFTVILAHLLLPDERLTFKKGFGVMLAFMGGLLLTLRGESGLADMAQADPRGYVLVFMGILSASAMGIYMRKNMRGFNTIDVGLVRMIVSALAVLPLGIWMSGFDISQVNSTGWSVVLYAAIAGTFFAMMLDFSNTIRFGATIAALVTFVIPVVAVVSGALLLGEQTTSGMLLGTLLVILGIWFIIQK